MNFKICILFFIALASPASSIEDDEEVTLKLLTSYNVDYNSAIKDEYSRIIVEDRTDEISVKIGILATYFRVFKKLVAWGVEENGFEHLYPSPEYDFDINIGSECKKGLEICLDTIISNISEIQPWILQDNIDLDELAMKKIIDDQRLGMEISASQILCYLTNSRIKAFEHIPYCSYRIQPPGTKLFTWTGKTFSKHNLIDEFVGKSFECATESFCPDPCCSGIPSVVRSSSKYAPLCKMNSCQKASTCIVKHFENDDLSKLRLNQFNVNCGCEEPGTIYRPDIGRCVHHNPCTKQSLCRDFGQECVNTASGYKCVCQLGYFRNGSNSCAPLKFSAPVYHGFALSEEMDEL
ncbi:EGF-like calcium-binding domain-containing protein [Caenorhabditis elegans]|uniref:EGF-like calcium-binding domain-containing protein n=1 Tax=Caenorhabditis elegans TaxID=6239 RepID=Q20209_CAEEL|nr:EGF-like calcium-binding domain-containing protein [Caenorhabditis elegans]CAA97795.2 EGF-like calcium-binding domain-containing protein [Caenorhabditis elegans]|eukprot:NP_502183.2 Uncharacterized protein CELE_F40F11.4 [Caenorhabditis elegans]